MSELFAAVREALPNLTDYLIYAAIAVVTVIGVFKCLLPLYTTTHSLRRAIRRLQDEAGENKERPVWQEPRFMGKRLKGCWLRFLQNAEQLDRRGLPCNVEDYINDDTVTHGPGNAQLAELVPSLLTSLGILGTFMGMTQGLNGLDVSSTDTMMTGIQNLLGGMQFAFGTSVAGVSCALVFNMLNRVAQGSSYRAIDDFVESFTQLAMQRPLDNDVQLICQNQDRNHLLGTVTDTISTSMSVSIEGAISRAMAPVAQSMDSFLLGATRAQVEGVGRIVNQFVDRMNAALGGQLLHLGETMTALNQNQQLTLDQLNQAFGSARGLADEVRRLQGVSQEVLSQFERYISELTAARVRDEGFEKNASELLQRMKQANAEQAALAQRLSEDSSSLGRSMAQYMKTGAEAAAGMQRVSDSTGKIGGSLSALVENVDGLSRAMGTFEQNMGALLTGLNSAMTQLPTEGTTAEVASQLSAMQRTLAGLEAAMQTQEKE